MTIILDGMGSDTYPVPELLAVDSLTKNQQNNIIIVGNQDVLLNNINKLGLKENKFHIHHAPEVVDMWDKPVASARKKPNNSMAIGVSLVKEGVGSAFVTAGNTGGAMFNGLRVLGRIKGVQRPALSAIFPTRKGNAVVLDIGANADCRPDFLFQFAQMGTTYSRIVNNIEQPKVGLLSNGEEAGKGNQLVKEAFQLLNASNLNFYGNVEPKEIFSGEVDVVVTDGFTGNVFMKGSEAIAKFITDVLRENLMSSFRSKIGALLAKPAFSSIKKLIDPAEIGAAPLLGIDGLVFVGHGRSNAKAISSAILLAKQMVDQELMMQLRNSIKSQFK